MNTVYYAKKKSKTNNSSSISHPYYVEGDALTTRGVIDDVCFCAKSLIDGKTLGVCSLERHSNTEVELCLVEIKDRQLLHCGIATNLINIAENFAYKSMKAENMFLFFAPRFEFEEEAWFMYKKLGYKPTCEGRMFTKELNEKTVSDVDLKTININLKEVSLKENPVLKK